MTMGRTCGAGAASLGRVAKILLPRNRTGAISRTYR